MIDMKIQMARDLCPYTKFAWHEKRDMCDTCKAIAMKLDDFRDDTTSEVAKAIVTDIVTIVKDEEDRRIGVREWFSMLYNPRRYVAARMVELKRKLAVKIGTRIC